MPLKISIAAGAGILPIVSIPAFAGPASTRQRRPGETLDKRSDMAPANRPGLHGAALKAEYEKRMNDWANYKRADARSPARR